MHDTTFFPIFSSDSTLLCASSSHGTIHVFSVEDPKRNKQSYLLSSTPFLGAGKNLVSINFVRKQNHTKHRKFCVFRNLGWGWVDFVLDILPCCLTIHQTSSVNCIAIFDKFLSPQAAFFG